MKRYVITASKDWVAVLGVALFAAILVTETGTGLLMLVCLAICGVLLKIEESPPRWLLRSSLRRWLRR